MPTPLRRRLRLARRYALYACALALVACAVLVGTVNQLLPLAERHPQAIAAWLSERAGQQVRFDALDARWTRRGPLLQLRGLHLGDTDGGVHVGEAEVLVAMYAGLLPGRSLTELRLRGLALTLQRADDGAWSVRGLPRRAGGGDPLDALRRLGELQVIGGRLQIDAPSLGLDTTLPRIDARLRVNGDRLQVGGRGWIDPARAPLQAVLDFDRGGGNGEAYLDAAPAELDAWSPLLRAAGVQLRAGRGRLQAWAELRANRVAALTVDADLQDLQLRGSALPGSDAAPELTWAQLRGRARWRLLGDGWRLDVPQLRIGSADAPQVLDGLAVQGGAAFAVAGRQLDVSPLIAAAALSDRLQPGLRRWLHLSRPQLRVSALQVAGRSDGPLQVGGDLDELGFQPVGGTPGASGLRGRVDGDADGVRLRPRSDAPVRFDWPTGFGVVHQIQLAGDIVGWRDGAGWRIGTPALRLQASDYAANVRGGLAFQNDGSRPRIELAAQLDDAQVPVAKKFWVHSKMSKAATDWLDMALEGGTITGGSGLASGDLDAWPFDGNDGRFEASARIRDGVIRFQPDWPAMQKLDGDVRFIANGFSVQGRGELHGVAVDRIEASIPDFKQGMLTVRADSRSNAGTLLSLLRASPLRRDYADTFDNLGAAGPAQTSFDMLLPLKAAMAGQGHLRGDIGLEGVRLSDRRWDLVFDNVRGTAHYARDGFVAEDLAVMHKGQPGQLTLRAGAPVRDPAQAFEASFSSRLDAAELFARAPQMDWLKPYVHGTSRWTVAVALPRAGAGGIQPPSLLSLDSDLVGTTLDLPAPLDKPAPRALDTHVDVALPFGEGDIDVAFGKRVALKAATRGDRTGVRVVMGSDTVRERPPEHGLVVTGRTRSLDAMDWISLARPAPPAGGAAPSSPALPLQQVDVQADRLLLLGGVFPGTRVQLRPADKGIAVTLGGPSLAGTLQVPDDEAAVLSGALDTVHWQPAAPAPAPVAPPTSADALVPAGPLAQTLPEPARKAVAEFDPAAIPPLALDIGDLRLGEVKLGAAVLRSRRLTDGMQLDQLQLRSPQQRIGLTGAWRGKGESATTRVSARVDSENLGGLSQDLGLGGQLRGGEGQVQLNIGWQGAPTAFKLASLQGDLKVDARNGQLLEVEPGAGRVLGLLSVAQLPRRLMFDFRDFFSKGLAFNRIDGEVRFDDGFARADGIRIEGPAVDIRMQGQADLAKQTFDQTVDVHPRSGNLLTVVGAVAGGPVGAAVGAAANAVLGKPLGELGARTYHVSGPWKDPKVEVIERDEKRPPQDASSVPDQSGGH